MGWNDLICFDRPFIANPGLPARFASNWPLTGRPDQHVRRNG
jgi:2,4-dienoyl-CoA reductase-like NADH-dependent reductase (Old Yellow Enzyme family)